MCRIITNRNVETDIGGGGADFVSEQLRVSISMALDDVVKKAGDGKRADTAGGWCDGGEVGTFADFCGEIAFQYAVFTGGTCIDKNGAGFNHRINN